AVGRNSHAPLVHDYNAHAHEPLPYSATLLEHEGELKATTGWDDRYHPLWRSPHHLPLRHGTYPGCLGLNPKIKKFADYAFSAELYNTRSAILVSISF
ncbi:MAG: hypothetical protein AB1664_24035, partial [Thermodesulfobacteriota bacterium]